MITKKNLADRFAAFQEPWSPRVAGDINDMQIKLVKLKGEFVWHSHDEENELFLVISGRLRMEFRDQEAQVVGPNVRARTDNEPDNDYTNTPRTTRIGRLFLLSFGPRVRGRRPPSCSPPPPRGARARLASPSNRGPGVGRL